MMNVSYSVFNSVPERPITCKIMGKTPKHRCLTIIHSVSAVVKTTDSF